MQFLFCLLIVCYSLVVEAGYFLKVIFPRAIPKISCLAIFLLISACATFMPIKPDIENKVYEQELVIEVNGEKFRGAGVVKHASEYKIKVYPDERIQFITWHTCHENHSEKKPKTGWFSKAFEFVLKDVPGVVDVASCSLEISLLDGDKKHIGLATIEFQDTRPEVSLPAIVKCNGVVKNYETGVSICQNAAGLVQQISFKEPVLIADKKQKEECKTMKTIDEKTYTFLMPVGKCTYYFGADRKLKGKMLLHRLQTIGFTEEQL